MTVDKEVNDESPADAGGRQGESSEWTLAIVPSPERNTGEDADRTKVAQGHCLYDTIFLDPERDHMDHE